MEAPNLQSAVILAVAAAPSQGDKIIVHEKYIAGFRLAGSLKY